MMINFNVDVEKPNVDFKRIASEIMNDWILQIENKKYRITEIEFYLKHDEHNDGYTHGHELQREMGKWYFHGSGIDITFGNECSYGGILIRAIYNLDTHKYVYGPIKVVTEVLSSIKNVYYSTLLFGLNPDSEKRIEREIPIAAPRVGLNSLHNQVMHDKFYRFVVMPKMQHANKTEIVEAMKKQGYSEEESNNIWG
jgi:hypothetical protein